MFSLRSGVESAPNRVTLAVESARAKWSGCGAIIDLSESNPTRVGLTDAGDQAFAALAKSDTRRYSPLSLGDLRARESVVAYYRDHGETVEPSQVVLSASTSEAYGWMFKLFCDPGDTVHLPRPGYPLFDELARLEGVCLSHFFSYPAGRWVLDLDGLAAGITSRSRAVMVVHPGNPTGAFLSRCERETLVRLCAERGLALVVDEVFLDYPAGVDPDRAGSFVSEKRCLTVTLSGLSKVVAAPQVKLGWAVFSGPDDMREEALRRMDFIADCWLSVSASAQCAAPELLAARRGVQRALRERIDRNDRGLRAMTLGTAVTVLPREGGWMAMLKVPAVCSDEEWVERLACEVGVVVTPGFFYDATGEGWLVVSLLPEPLIFDEGIERIKTLVQRVIEE